MVKRLFLGGIIGETLKCGLHLLIYILPDFNLAQYIGKRQGATLIKMPPLTRISGGKA